MKILFLTDFIPPRSIGGAAQSVWRVAQQLNLLGHEVFVIATVQDKQYACKENRNGIVVYSIYANYNERYRQFISLYNRAVLTRVEAILNEVRPEIIHADIVHFYLSYAALKLAHQYAKRVFLTLRDFMTISYGKVELKHHERGNEYFKVHWWNNLFYARKRFNPLRNMVIRYYLKYVDQIFSCSQYLAEFLNINGIHGVVPIHNGLIIRDVSVLQSEIDTFKKTHNVNGKSLILFPARVSPAKGLYVVMDAMQKVIAKIPNSALVIAGMQDCDQAQAHKYACNLGIRQNIIFLNWTTGRELDVVYNAADVILAPSLYPDPFPTVNLEAAIYKKPVITTCFGGAKEFIIDGETGYVINPFDNDMLMGKIIDLLQNPEKGKHFGIAAHNRLCREFTVEKQTQQLLQWYNGSVTRDRKSSHAKR